MFGFSTETATTTWTEPESDDVVLSFDPYPEMTAPQPEAEWRHGEPHWADDVDESDPQPGHDDHDYDPDPNADLYDLPLGTERQHPS